MHNVQKDDLFIVGICGKAGAGKTTLANMILEQFLQLTDHKIGCVIVPFAKALKDMAIEMGWDGVKDERGRKLLQMLGTDICRNLLDENYWVKRWEEALAKERAKGIQLVVADDVRFNNECVCVANLSGEIYKVVGRGYELSTDSANHESEKELFIADDRLISNVSTFEALECRAKEIVKRLINWSY